MSGFLQSAVDTSARAEFAEGNYAWYFFCRECQLGKPYAAGRTGRKNESKAEERAADA